MPIYINCRVVPYINIMLIMLLKYYFQHLSHCTIQSFQMRSSAHVKANCGEQHSKNINVCKETYSNNCGLGYTGNHSLGLQSNHFVQEERKIGWSNNLFLKKLESVNQFTVTI